MEKLYKDFSLFLRTAGFANSKFVLAKVKPVQVLHEKKGEQQFFVCSVVDLLLLQSSLEMQGTPASIKT